MEAENTTPQSNLAAIVFTDIVGFSRMMSENEDTALPRAKAELTRLKELCEKHNGKVLKSTGDGLLMHFTSAVKAVSCALEIQKPGASTVDHSLQHRIGIHLGDVYLDDGDVMGDGVNIAARLQTQADPGGICISKTVYDVVKNRLAIQATFLGPRELKNISEAVPIYKILIEAQSRGTSIRREHPARRATRMLPLKVGMFLALPSLAIGLGIYAGMHKFGTANQFATTTAIAKPSTPLSPTAARVVGAWQSIQRHAVIAFLPDGRFGIDLAFGDRKMLGVVGTWQASGDTLTTVRTDPAKTMISHIVSLTDSQMILQGETGPRFLERIPMPDMQTVTLSKMPANPSQDPNRPQLSPLAETAPAMQSYNLGVAAFNAGNYDQAIAKFTEASALKPDFYQAMARRAESYELNGSFDKSLDDYNHLLQARPKDPILFHNRAIVNIKAGKYQQTLDDETNALALKHDFVNALIFRGRAHTLLGQYPQALTDLNAALALDPNNAQAHIDRGVAKKASGDVAGGQPDLDQGQALQARMPSHAISK